jgi:hypothetical protein
LTVRIRDRTLLNALLLSSFCLIVASCGFVDFAGGSDGLTFVNRSDRSFAPIVFDRKDMELIDPRPWLTEEEFDERKIEPGSSAELHQTGGYEKGDDLAVILYAQCDCDRSVESSVLECPGEAPTASFFSVPATELVKRNFRVVVNDVPPPTCRVYD